MNRLSSGDTDVAIPGGDRKDELGIMAGAVDVFRRNMLEAGTLREAQEAAKQQAEMEKKALQRQMADRFEADVKGVVSAVAKATQDMQRVAREITTSVSGTSARAAAAAAASEEASASVNTVAAVRSPTPAASPTTPWSRPGKPPRWSQASRRPARRSATCCA
jgi:methyl-accepting chemotaxis protein